jgi:radical SAM protein with 4Fe4S-binding SPASM domain
MKLNKKYLDDPREYDKKTFRVQWHLTERCNLKCIHCYQDEIQIKEELSFDQIKKAAIMLKKTIDKWGMLCEISVTGGEPFVRKDWFEICKMFEELDFFLSILTNGTIITEEILEKLKQLKNLKYIQVSLDGGTRSVHERIRGINTFEKALSTIRLFKENGFRVATKFTIHKLNQNDLKAYLDLTENIDVDLISVARLIPWGAGKQIKEMTMSKLEVKRAFELILSYAKKNAGKKLYNTRRPLWCLLKDSDTDLGGRCVAAYNGLTVLPNGDVLPCRPMGVVVGNILKNTFFEIWYTSDFLWKVRNMSRKGCEKCNNYELCGGCIAISNALHNDFFVKDPQCFKELMK